MTEFRVQAKWIGPGGQHTWLDTGMRIMADSREDERALELLKRDLKSAEATNPGDYRIVYKGDEVVDD